MARKSLNELSGIANAIARSGAQSKDRGPRNTAPALGALQGSLSAIREIGPELIDDWGPTDRIDGFTAVNSEDESDGFEALKTSILEDGQQVPILLRRSQTEGRFEAIYGRRRLRVCRDLGIKVKANVQDVDDATALLAKGLENAARRNLSFYEKARFAAAIQEAGHSSAVARKVLSVSASGLSHLTKITEHVPRDLGDLIGAAPKSGRPKWTQLAEDLSAGKLSATGAISFVNALDAKKINSDARLDLLLAEFSRRDARQGNPLELHPVTGVTIKSGRGQIALIVRRAGESAGFAAWLDTHLEDIINTSYREFTSVNSKDDT